MPQYQSPGVYTEEVPGTPPIVGVGTSTAGFVGEVDAAAAGFEMPLQPGSDTDSFTEAPVNEPRLVTNFEQFKTQFGDFQTANATLAHAVFGFFQNLGTRCWVVRADDVTDATDVGAALEKFEVIDEIAIVAAPGAVTAAVQEEVIAHCSTMGDRFAIIDGQQNPTTIDPDDIQGTVGDSDFAALYFPWIRAVDRVSGGGSSTLMPPSGHVAGVYSRVDEARGVHKAPANEPVEGALGLEYLVSTREQDGLNPSGINVIRSFNGNIVVWGARTLGDDNREFTYVNVRRLMNFLRESLDEGTRFVVFEPNTPALWQRIIRSVSAFLTNVWRDGALFGTTPEQAFFVKCDETTNPPEVRALGQVVTEIGVAIARPAEFVIFRISQEVPA